MKKLYEESMLYDFYGELLTEHQKFIYEDFVLNDLSLGEIAQDRGISRQGVYDIVRRCRKQLQGYEEKLKLIERFRQTRSSVSEIRKLAIAAVEETQTSDPVHEKCVKIRQLADDVMDSL